MSDKFFISWFCFVVFMVVVTFVGYGVAVYCGFLFLEDRVMPVIERAVDE